MSDRRPERPVTGDGMLPPVGARTPGLEDLTSPDGEPRPGHSARPDRDDDWEGEWEGEWDEPNYLVRRAIVIGVGIVVVAVLAWVVVGLLGGDDGSSTSELSSADWNTAVVLTADEIRTVDPGSGEIIDTFPASDDLLDAQSLVVGKVLVTMNDAGRIVQTDLTDGSTTRGRAGLDQSLRTTRDNPTIAVAGPDVGGDVTVIDTATRRTISIGDVANLDDPLMFANDIRVNPSGSHAAVADARSFQSFVVDITTEASIPLAGQVVDIGDDRVVTAQRAGDRTELEFYDLIGDRLGSVDVPTPAAALLTSEGRMLLVGADGMIRVVDADGGIDEVGVIADPTNPTATIEVESGSPTLGGERLVLTTTRHVVVLDESGSQVAFLAGSIQGLLTSATRCLAVGTTSTASPKTLIDLDDGSVVTEFTGTVSTASVDGCAVALIGASPQQLVIDGEIVDGSGASIVSVAPDGSSYVVLDGRDLELVAGDSTIELTDDAAVIHFADIG